MSQNAERAGPLPSMLDVDPDALFPCPYNPSHLVSTARFPYHLSKCRQSHEQARKMRTCPFNARHRVLKKEMAAHMALCPDRAYVEATLAHEAAHSQKEPSRLTVPPSSWVPQPSQEDWEAEIEEDGQSQPYIWGTSAMLPSVTTRNIADTAYGGALFPCTPDPVSLKHKPYSIICPMVHPTWEAKHHEAAMQYDTRSLEPPVRSIVVRLGTLYVLSLFYRVAPFSDQWTKVLEWSNSVEETTHAKRLGMPPNVSIILNNPRKRNVLSLDMLRCLRSDLTDDLNNPALRIIVISAVGPVFSSGHDLSELTAEYGREHHTRVFETCTEVMRTIQRLPVPVLAKVDGLATAAGCQLVASCDVALASERSRFATPGVNVGLFCSTPGVALGRSVPKKVAMEMLLTGEPISASEALAHGLLSRVVPVEQLDGEVERVARSVCRLSRSVLALGKRAFLSQMSRDWDAAYALAQAAMLDNLQLPDGQEGIRAFVEKRPPQWEQLPGSAHDGNGDGDSTKK